MHFLLVRHRVVRSLREGFLMATERTVVKFLVGDREASDEYFLSDSDELFVDNETGVLVVKNLSATPRRQVTYNRSAWVKITSEEI
jgi:hypothetical protein